MEGNYDFQAQSARYRDVYAGRRPYRQFCSGSLSCWSRRRHASIHRPDADLRSGAQRFRRQLDRAAIILYPMLGIGGSYISWLCGNVADIRVPAATMAQRVAGAEPGSPEGDVMATIGIAGSVFVSVAILTLFTFIGSAIMPMVPKFVTKAFGFILPAVFGAVYAELSRSTLKSAC